jgi:multiple sugar transport system permease protein
MEAVSNIGRRGSARWWMMGAGLLIAAVFLFPIYWMISSSLETQQQIFATPAPWFPPSPTLQGYGAAIASQLPHIAVSAEVAVGTTLLSLLIALPAAYALAHFRMRITVAIVLALLFTQMIPSVTMITPLFLIFYQLHLINTIPGLVLADSTYAVPFDILILRAFLESVPFELSEAAFVDGAGEWGAFLRVVIPVSISGVVTAGLFSFLFAWGDFLNALTMMNNSSGQPIMLSLYTFIGQYQTSWNAVMATAVLASIPAVVLLLIFQRYITAGLTGGALKG